MRGRKRGEQLIKLATLTEVDEVDEYGDITGAKVKTYTPSTEFMGSVSTNATEPELTQAGLVTDYDRILTVFKDYGLAEGNRLYVSSNTPNYVIKRCITQEKGQVFRYTLQKLS